MRPAAFDLCGSKRATLSAPADFRSVFSREKESEKICVCAVLPFDHAFMAALSAVLLAGRNLFRHS